MLNIKVLIIGIGEIGLKVASYILERKGLEIVGILEKDVAKIGKDIGNLLNRKKTGILVSDSLEEIVKKSKPEVAIVTTISDINLVFESIKDLIKYKIAVISTCEELSYPWEKAKKVANEIDKLAKENDVSIIGTGVNPGFLMDALPTFLTAVCKKVNSIKITRIQDASMRRDKFKEKIGVGIEYQTFIEKAREGKIGHIGLRESLDMIASKLNWRLDNYEEKVTPVIAKERMLDKNKQIKIKKIIGVKQTGIGYKNGKEKITLIFKASLNEKNAFDKIEIIGEPNITSKIKAGVNGDIATAAIIVNSIKEIIKAPSGLRTMVDIPLLSYFE